MNDEILPGRIYRHFKTLGLYTVLAVAIKEDTGEPMVVYQSGFDGKVWVRALDNFCEELWLPGIPGPTKRFSIVTD